MDIFITGNLPKDENDTGQTVKLQIPALPTAITCSNSARMMNFDILDFGSVEEPNGIEPTGYTWSAILPGSGRKNEPWIRGKWIDPKIIENYFSVWKKNGVKLKLLITGTPVNSYVYLKNYETNYSGGFGDVSYSVTFVTAVDLSVTFEKVKVSTPAPSRPTPTPSRTYTVKKGDCLWNIARKYYGNGSQYTKIYNANKDTIESWAKKYGRKSSQNGHWIYAGEVLIIP